MKVINFFGSPGVGKTTFTMELTAMFKKNQIDAEASLEYVKEYIHTDSNHLLAYQNYIFAHQERQIRIFDNSKEVEFAVTDAPLLHSAFYAPENYPVFFKELVFEIFNSYDNINYFINRTHPYSHQGRLQDEKKSDLLSIKLKAFLINNNISFTEINSNDNIQSVILNDLLNNHRVLDYQLNKKIR